MLSQSSGSIYLTQKRLSKAADSGIASSVAETIASVDFSANVEVGSSDPYEILFRASNKKDLKVSTRVKYQDAGAFMERYAEVCRAGMGSSLKKRDRKKVKKAPK